MRQLLDPQLASRFGRAAYDRFWSNGAASHKAHISALEVVYSKMLQRNRREHEHEVQVLESAV